MRTPPSISWLAAGQARRCDQPRAAFFLFGGSGGCGRWRKSTREVILHWPNGVRLPHVTRMPIRFLSALLAISLLTGCPKESKDKKAAKADKTKDQSGDTTFQGFVGRLRTAVDKKDTQMLASMMSPDFGYRWDTPPAGEDPFAYWDRTRSWGELAALMRAQWVPYDGYMVVPPQFASQGSDYAGYRAGVRQVNGSWRFAYFVPAAPAEPPPPPSPAPTAL